MRGTAASPYDIVNVCGYGHSGSLIGEVFRDQIDRVVVAMKAGRVDYTEIDHSGPQLLVGRGQPEAVADPR